MRLPQFIKPSSRSAEFEDQITPMKEKTFAELYCEQHKISLDEFTRSVLRKTLYPQARFLAPILTFLSKRHFAADVEFAISVGGLRRYREYTIESEGYAHHPENLGFLRATLNLRVSSRLMRRLVRKTLHTDPSVTEGESVHSAVPFCGAASGRAEVGPGASR